MTRFRGGRFGRRRSGGWPPYVPRRAVAVFECPETGENVTYTDCAECPQWGVHIENDDERCFYEYRRLLSEGYFATSQEEWAEHLTQADPKTHEELVEEETNRERVRRELDEERARWEELRERDAENDDEDDEEDDDEDDDEENEFGY